MANSLIHFYTKSNNVLFHISNTEVEEIMLGRDRVSRHTKKHMNVPMEFGADKGSVMLGWHSPPSHLGDLSPPGQ